MRLLEGAWDRGNHRLLDEPAQANLGVRLSACLRGLANHRIIEKEIRYVRRVPVYRTPLTERRRLRNRCWLSAEGK